MFQSKHGFHSCFVGEMHLFFVKLNPVKPNYSQSDPKMHHFVLIRVFSVFPREYVLHKNIKIKNSTSMRAFYIISAQWGYFSSNPFIIPAIYSFYFVLSCFSVHSFYIVVISSHICVLYDWVATKQMMCPLH